MKSHLLPWVMILSAIWCLVFLASIAWNLHNNHNTAVDQALFWAKAAIDKDITYRQLVASVGGVYMPIDQGIKPNPQLAHIPYRDVTTEEGRRLTLVNSSYFTRLIHDREVSNSPNGVRGHVTSLKPLRPENTPNEWEKEALQAFQQGVRERSGVVTENGAEYFSLMLPRIAKESCMGCHGHQGYQLGDVIGGISVSVPMSGLQAESKKRVYLMSIWHFLLWLGGMLGLLLGYYLLRRQEQQMRYSALYDLLTGLPNRALLIDRLNQQLETVKRHNHMGAVLFIDLDRFKTINDSLGHSVGDQLLWAAGQTLQKTLRHEDTVARLGGDEFVVLLVKLDSDPKAVVAEVQAITCKILEALAHPHQIGGHRLHATSSIGVALFSHESKNAHDVLQQADVAMYRAKAAGGNCSQFFRPSMQHAAEERLDAEHALRHALEREEFLLYYQPILDIRQPGRIVGAEALLRWQHPEKGIKFPGEFIDIAEETGLILDLGDWVICEACRQIHEWSVNKPDVNWGHISINISPRQFQQADFASKLINAVQMAEVDPAKLCLELTENLLVRDIEDVAGKMRELKAYGFQFSIDDFGTGYSSLAYLKQLPLDTLKIDQSFVRDITTNPSDVAIVESILAMSSRMGFWVVAEGVETEEQLMFMAEHDCDFYQGFLYSPAVTAEKFLLLLSNNG